MQKIAIVNLNDPFRDPQYVSVKIEGHCNHADTDVVTYGKQLDHSGFMYDADEEICLKCRAWRLTDGEIWYNEDQEEVIC